MSSDQPASDGRPKDEGSIKETIESIIIAFILAFVFRAFVVEAFVIPTGSMAPTLLGQHEQFVCPQCGDRFVVGPRDYLLVNEGRGVPASLQGNVPPDRNNKNARRRDPLEVTCPMCKYPVEQTMRALDSGDRILVLKYIYEFAEPSRWDVVVFKNPENPLENYIKRLVGKPSEWLWIVRGNVYTRPTDSDPWQIERKPEKVQRAVWQPIYHSDYVPRDGGSDPLRNRWHQWSMPWQPADSAHWTYGDDRRTYHFDGAAPSGRLDFDSDNQRAAVDYYPYNSFNLMTGKENTSNGQDIVEELRLAATFTPQTNPLQATLALTTAERRFVAMVNADGSAQLEWTLLNSEPLIEKRESAPAGTVSWRIERGTRLELWHVDQAVMLWADGECVLELTYNDELSDDALHALAAEDVRQQPQVSIDVAGGEAKLSQVDLDRDLYYTKQDGAADPRATLSAIRLEEDQFFCLGDNSPQSKDGRLWTTVDPWITYDCSEGAAPLPAGIVPRKLLIGKAFFVYWPSAYRTNPQHAFPGLVPNFGKMRFIK